jgi:hypothetical protein
MPFVIKHKQTNQIFSCKLINIYDLEYYGIKSWEDPEQAERELAPFLQKQGVDRPDDWELFEAPEMLMKMFNVKLNNNALRRVYINEQGKAEARPAGESGEQQ